MKKIIRSLKASNSRGSEEGDLASSSLKQEDEDPELDVIIDGSSLLASLCSQGKSLSNPSTQKNLILFGKLFNDFYRERDQQPTEEELAICGRVMSGDINSLSKGEFFILNGIISSGNPEHNNIVLFSKWVNDFYKENGGHPTEKDLKIYDKVMSGKLNSLSEEEQDTFHAILMFGEQKKLEHKNHENEDGQMAQMTGLHFFQAALNHYLRIKDRQATREELDIIGIIKQGNNELTELQRGLYTEITTCYARSFSKDKKS